MLSRQEMIFFLKKNPRRARRAMMMKLMRKAYDVSPANSWYSRFSCWELSNLKKKKIRTKTHESRIFRL